MKIRHAAAYLGLMLAQPACAAQAIEEFFKDRVIDLYIPSSAGGSFDIYGRLFGRYLSRHLPGAPPILPRNMPGASGFGMTNWLYSVAPRDGTAIGLPPPQVALHQLLGMEDVKFDARRFNWIFRAAPVTEVTYTWYTSPTRSVEDARRRETIMGAVSPSSGGAVYLNQLNAIAGSHFKVVTGYRGMTEINLAMERGEVEGTTKPWAALKAENPVWLSDHKLNFLVQYGIERAPELKDVPTRTELSTTELDRQTFRLLASVPTIGRSFAAAPGVPADRVEALRKAFSDTAQDPEFLAEAQAQHVDLGSLDGAALQSLVGETFNYSSAVIARVRETGAQ